MALDALRAIVLPHATAHARDVIARQWLLLDRADACRDGDPLTTRTERETWAGYALAWSLAAELYPAHAARHARHAAGWASLVVGVDAVRAAGCEPAGRAELEGEVGDHG